ncbi:alpha/beta fold hydrolase [Streptomyces sp. NPDC059355]|uniref:alpha/beta fold hydrolase n=1 Tax=Streptomyces sp. NPDC059355 TaxID=3346811 RepID=UPI0036D142A1
MRAALAGVGGVLGILIGIYADEARAVLAWVGAHAVAPAGVALLASGVGFGLGWWGGRAGSGGRDAGSAVVEGSFEISADDFDVDLPADHMVFGRRLRYLERATASRDLVVLLHGLGTDASEFRPYMASARPHTVALTTFGHHPEEARDARYRPIGLATHTELIAGAIRALSRRHPGKRLVLVGFSYGADTVLRLAERWAERPEQRPAFAGVLLLDPNMNRSTLPVTRALAGLDLSDPAAALRGIVAGTRDLDAFANFCDYLHRIAGKDLAQVCRYAGEVWEDAEEVGSYERFVRRCERLRSVCGGPVRIHFSTRFETHFNDLVAHARRHGVRGVFDLRRIDHFVLCAEPALRPQVEALVAGSPAPAPEG